MRNLKDFKTTFQDYKSRLPSYYKEDQVAKTWDFQEALVFKRFDSFMVRLFTLEEFFLTAIQFLKLEKVEIGGIRGKALTTNIGKVYEEFKDLYGVFSNRTYDGLDPHDRGFLKDYEKFNNKIFSLDRKLGAILSRAFDDCVVTESIFKLLNIFGTLIKRPLIASELSDKMPMLVTKLGHEMDEAKEIFKKQQGRIKEEGKALNDKNMPPISGQLRFAHEIRTKIKSGMRNFMELNHPIQASKAGESVVDKYKEMIGLLMKYEEENYYHWTRSLDRKTSAGLGKPLLIREDKRKLKVNFANSIMSTLIEVKHIQKDFPVRNVPDHAKEIFKRFDDFRNYNNSLDQTVCLYNYLLSNTVEQEYELIKDEIEELDELIEPAETTLTWNAEHIWPYVERLRTTSKDLNRRVQKAQENVAKIKKLISKWENEPLFLRINDTKKEALFNLEDRQERKEKRYEEIQTANLEIKELLEENKKLFHANVKPDSAKQYWTNYLIYLDEMIAKGLLKTIATSVGYLLDQTDIKKDISPLFEIKLELCEPEIIFRPSLDVKINNNFHDICDGILDDIYKMAGLVPRIFQKDGENGNESYLVVINEHAELKKLKAEFTKRVEDATDKANQKLQSYLNYAYLWTESRKDFMYFFINYSRQLTEDEIVQLEDDEKSIKKQSPSLDQFREHIDQYEAIFEQAKEIEYSKIFNKWLRLDISPFRFTLLNCIKRWSYGFKKYLLEHVTDSLNELNNFIEKADEGLMVSVQEGDYAALINVMQILQTVKEKQATTDTMFEPLKDIIELVKKYGVIIPEESIVQLTELPERWANTKRLSVSAKQQVAPLQGIEVGRMKERIEEYERNQKVFRSKFTQMRFYDYTCKSPYEHLTQAFMLIQELDKKIKELQSQAALFEVTIPKFPLIDKCRKENRMLKQLWDYIFLVRTSIDEWKTTLWIHIDVENMDMECKKFAKDIRGLDKEMRQWHAFTGLEMTVKNMLTDIQARGEEGALEWAKKLDGNI